MTERKMLRAKEGMIYAEQGNGETLGTYKKQADGVLWAAAPELLAALKNALTVIENEWPEDCLPETVKGYRAIIAKVEGKNEPE